MKRALGWLATAGLVLAVAPSLRADPPAPPAGSGSPPRPHDERVERGLEQLRRHIRGLPSALPPVAADSANVRSPAPSDSAASERPTLEELARRWAELAATRGERRERHRAELLHEAGLRLTDPRVLAELKLHATRMADLARLEFLTKNVRSGAERDKLLARVARLGLRETGRHQRRMAQLLQAAPTASAAPAPSGAAAPAPSAAPAAPAGSNNGATH